MPKEHIILTTPEFFLFNNTIVKFFVLYRRIPRKIRVIRNYHYKNLLFYNDKVFNSKINFGVRNQRMGGRTFSETRGILREGGIKKHS